MYYENKDTNKFGGKMRDTIITTFVLLLMIAVFLWFGAYWG